MSELKDDFLVGLKAGAVPFIFALVASVPAALLVLSFQGFWYSYFACLTGLFSLGSAVFFMILGVDMDSAWGGFLVVALGVALRFGWMFFGAYSTRNMHRGVMVGISILFQCGLIACGLIFTVGSVQ